MMKALKPGMASSEVCCLPQQIGYAMHKLAQGNGHRLLSHRDGKGKGYKFYRLVRDVACHFAEADSALDPRT